MADLRRFCNQVSNDLVNFSQTIYLSKVYVASFVDLVLHCYCVGLSFKIPIIDEVSYHHSLKEQVLDIDNQTAITQDNVKINISGVLYFRIKDPYKASY